MGVMAKAFLEAIAGNSTKAQTVFAKCSHVFKAVLACTHLSTPARKIRVASERPAGAPGLISAPGCWQANCPVPRCHITSTR